MRYFSLVLITALATATCSEPAPSSDDDDGSTSTGGGGSMTVPGGPEIISLEAIPSTLVDGDSLQVVATVTDPDGLEDVVGGSLRTEDGSSAYGPFTSLGGGTWSISLTWQDIEQVAPVTSLARTFRAEFADTTQKIGVAYIEIVFADCPLLCTALFDCGLESGNCPGFAEANRPDFEEGCGFVCDSNPSEFAALFVPDDCAATVANFSSAEPGFAEVCQNGFGAGGAGGA